MAKRIRFNADCIIVGKEYRKATEEWKTPEGRVFPARPKSWYLHIVLGDKRDLDELFNGEPTLAVVQVSKETFKNVVKYTPTECFVEMVGALGNARTKVLSLKGYDIVGVVEDEDNEDDDE